MSTEHQRYSPGHQRAAIATYAKAHGYQIVRSYADEGVSGVSMKNRSGLKALLADVLAGEPGFEKVLVYDVSRWGRFQNTDQAAHYEFLCAEAGVTVEYVAELFENDGSLSSVVMKTVKRAMAAEFSRDLSEKLKLSQNRLAALGHWQGGPAGYGLRRRMILPDGRLGPVMEFGERKAFQGAHVVLVPGPPDEVFVVQRIFTMFVRGDVLRSDIVRRLNAEGIPASRGRSWNMRRLNEILTSRKYMGDVEFGKSTGELGLARQNLPRSDWRRAKQALQPLVSRAVFEAAQRKIAEQQPRYSRDEVLQALQRMKATHGAITERLLKGQEAGPGSTAVRRHFGSIAGACAAVGLDRVASPKSGRIFLPDDLALDRLRTLYKRHGYLSVSLIDDDPTTPCAGTYAKRFGGLRSAYAMVGFIPLTKAQAGSAVGQARRVAAQFRRSGSGTVGGAISNFAHQLRKASAEGDK